MPLPRDDTAADPWELPGFEVLALLGYGATGEVWRARELSSGELVALKRVRPGAAPGAGPALRREAALLRGLDTPYLVRLRAVLGDDEAPVLVLDHAAGGSLAGLLLARGRLEPGEVVTVAVPVAEALAAAHARGLVHGDVSPSNVLLTADGMPLLSDLGLARLADAEAAGAVDGTAEYADPAVLAGAAPGPASDVRALAAVCHHALAGSPPHGGGPVPAPAEAVLEAVRAGGRAPLGLLAPQAPRALVAAVEAGLADDPASRPTAAELALALRRAAAPLPLRLVPPDGSDAARGEETRPTHRVREAPAPAVPAPSGPRARLPRWLPVSVTAVLLVAGAALLGWRLGETPAPVAAPVAAAAPSAVPSAAPSAAPSAVPTSGSPEALAGPTPAPAAAGAAAPDWTRLLDELDAVRAAAYEAGDPEALAGTYAPGSPALVADRATLSALVAQGRTARGVRHEVRGVQQLALDDTWARLRVRDVLAAHEVLGPTGEVLERRPGRGEADVEVHLVRTPDGWRLREVRPV